MLKFVKNPNLPDTNVKVVIMSGIHNKFCTELEKMGIDIIRVEANENLDIPENTHADLQCQHLGDEYMILPSKIHNLREKLEKIGLKTVISNKELKKDYPNNVFMNSARIANKMICNIKTIDKNIIEYCKQNNIKLIHTNQGYTKCSTAIIDKNSIITADDTIYEAARLNNIDALKIRPGYIKLKGYNYGFIGGCCTLISKNKLVFTGNIKFHPDYQSIKNFVEKRNIEIISLSNDELIDIGGIIPIIESY